MGSTFKSPKAPAPMNVEAVGRQQQQQNTTNAYQQAAFNRPNQTDSFGNTLNYAQSGTDAQGNPIFSVNQQLGQTGQQMAGGFAGLGQAYFDQAGNRPDLGSGAALDRAYSAATANIEPRFQRANDQMVNRLRNQGLDPTSEAYKSQVNDLALQQHEARNSLYSQLQGQMFNQGLAERNQQMGELNPGLQFGMGTTRPNVVNTPGVNVGNVDYVGLNQARYAQEMEQYRQKQAARSAGLGGLASLGGTVIGGVLGGPIGASIGGSLGGAFGGGGGMGMPGGGSAFAGANDPAGSYYYYG